MSTTEKVLLNDNIDDFLLKEYDSIVAAHFNTLNSISSFFKYYILIASIPFYGLGFIVKDLFDKNSSLYIEKIPQLNLNIFATSVYIIVLISIFIMWYLINLRHDAVLYARTTNGLRKWFYTKSPDNKLLESVRVLPYSTTKPNYREGIFWPIVLTITIINTAYCSLAYITIFKLKNYPFFLLHLFVCISIHIFLYWFLSNRREYSYFKSHNIGIDIDGVLNKHRDHFCEILFKNCGIKLDPKNITEIPVHQIPGISVTQAHELQVFNDPEYWIDMPLNDDVESIINRLFKGLRYNITIITYRPWPTFDDVNVLRAWKNAATRILDESELYRCEYFKYWYYRFRLWQNEKFAMTVITYAWLKKHHINFSKLIIEKGSEYTADPDWKHKNRFQIARKKTMKFFIEDDIYKAYKLSNICDFVYLLDHPYNRQILDNKGLTVVIPKNIIRIKSWFELGKDLKQRV